MSLVLANGFGVVPTCVSMKNWELKVEWTLLIAPVGKCRCGALDMSHVHPRSAPVGTQVA